MKRLWLILFVINSVWGQTSKPLSVDNLAWLTGSWQGPINGNILEETWLPPRAGTIVALVRSSNESGTNFVEIIIIKEINGTLELQLQLFDNSLKPINNNPHSFELTKIENNYISFKGVTSGAHKTLSYERPEKNVFYIRFHPHDGDEVEISSSDGAEFLILAGPEINEPIARYGPFVMNTRAEIHQAVMDFQSGNLA